MSYVDVIDNFLSDYEFKSFQSLMMANDFPWFYTDGIYADNEPRRFQFIHMFYERFGENQSPKYMWLEPILKKLNMKELVRVKANLTTRTLFPRGGGYHTDFTDMKTSIFYINTCNGGTKFKGNAKVKSVANRLVTFDSNIEHQGVTTTDQKRRVVVNINYRE